MDLKDDVAVHQCHAGDGDGADMILYLNGKRIAVSFYPSTGLPAGEVGSAQPQACIEDSIIQRLGQAILADVEEYEEITDQILETVLDIGKSVFDEVAPVNKIISLPANQDLHTLLYPPTLAFRLMTVGSTPVIIPIDPNDSYTCIEPNFDEDPESDLEIDNNLFQHSSQGITVVETFVQGTGHLVSRVLVNKKEMLCKARSQGLRYSDLEHELGSMQKIRKACLHDHTPMRVPALLGYVMHPESGCVIGFLREWVPGFRLRNISITSTPENRRQMWARQIAETVHHLHNIGVIWGDGKASNVIIDDEDIAWLIDFGGGFTEGWVPEELAGTVEGDEEAVKKIADFLGVRYEDSQE